MRMERHKHIRWYNLEIRSTRLWWKREEGNKQVENKDSLVSDFDKESPCNRGSRGESTVAGPCLMRGAFTLGYSEPVKSPATEVECVNIKGLGSWALQKASWKGFKGVETQRQASCAWGPPLPPYLHMFGPLCLLELAQIQPITDIRVNNPTEWHLQLSSLSSVNSSPP